MIYKFNPIEDTYDLIADETMFHVKDPVDTYNSLPITGNGENDMRFVKDTDEAYVWTIASPSGARTNWKQISGVGGDMFKSTYDIDDNGIIDKAENVDDGVGNVSTAIDVKDAVDKKHDKLHEINNTLNHLGISGSGIEDNFMAIDGSGLPKNSGKSTIDFANASHNHVESDITDLDHYTSEDFSDDFGLADLADLATKSYNDLTDKPDLSDLHFHANKVELDLVTDGNHDVRVDNPHIVTVDQLDLASGTVASDIDDAISKKHTQNTDTGTSNNFDVTGEISIKLYSQNDEPTLGQDNRIAIWIDTDDTNRVYLLYRRGVGDQVAVELA